MEDDLVLVEILKKNLGLTIKELFEEGIKKKDYVEYLSQDLLEPNKFQTWLYEGTFQNFDGFKFFESSSFQTIEGNYWKIVHEPVGK